MADKATNGTDDLVQAYNRAVESAVGAFDTGIAQATNTVKLLADAAEAERREYGKVLEQGAIQARKRSENLAAVLPVMFQGFAVKPGAAAPEIGPQVFNQAFNPDVKESVSKLIEGETAFYESLAQAWMQYILDSEQRRSAATKALMESNARVIESGQKAAKGAVEYGEAVFNWSVETVNAQNAKGKQG